ncbi:MAG: DJ-1/PfpI family protein [Dysgonomonas sp.]
MAKKVAVIAFNPVNGLGLFQYLETFFENGIKYKTFAISDSKEIKTNSGVKIVLDDTIANLKGHEKDFDALVFSCGDAMLTFAENADKKYYKDMFDVIGKFNEEGKIIAGHCAAAIMFDNADITAGKKVAVHPYGKSAVKKGIATDDKFVVDKNLYTAQSENYIWQLIPDLLKTLKQ